MRRSGSIDPAALARSIPTSGELQDNRTLPGRVRAPARPRALARSACVPQVPGGPQPPEPALQARHSTRPIYSVRIGLGYRALGVREADEIVWFWIGSHADYDQLLSDLAARL